ncbi:hypothetical protein D3C72_2251330 [compost metagenome]
MASDALKLKLIRRAISVDGWFEPRYLQTALQQQGLEKRWQSFDAKGVAKASAGTPVSQR